MDQVVVILYTNASSRHANLPLYIAFTESAEPFHRDGSYMGAISNVRFAGKKFLTVICADYGLIELEYKSNGQILMALLYVFVVKKLKSWGLE